MRINHNISSMITQSSLYQVNTAMSTSLQRLSTGLRINAAQDDAAGLGVSENLRTQTTGLGQAIKNTQDGISLLNIADGALNEQSNILQRMRTLVIQAMNSTYTSTERSYMSTEFNQLFSELDRIAKITNFNGKQLFATPMSDGSGQGAYQANQVNTQEPPHIVDGKTMWAPADQALQDPFGVNNTSSANMFNFFIGSNYTAQDMAAARDQTGGAASPVNSFSPGAGDVLTIEMGQMDTNALLEPNSTNGDAADYWNSFEVDWNNNPADMALFNAYVADGQNFNLFTDDGVNPNQNAAGFKLQTLLKVIDGSDSLTDNERNTGFNGNATDPTGIKRVNMMRAYIGAQTNRLEHALNNMMNQQTNTQAAESTIRDVDFAHETATFTKNQILTQSATAMLAQANMVPQNMLSLLK
ncbi:MAG: flagellin [Chitinivibrionales bacterium]|nr:flagellin [Chitinivibrionales bacterium]